MLQRSIALVYNLALGAEFVLYVAGSATRQCKSHLFFIASVHSARKIVLCYTPFDKTIINCFICTNPAGGAILVKQFLHYDKLNNYTFFPTLLFESTTLCKSLEMVAVL